MNAKRTMLIGLGLFAILMLATLPMMAMAQEGNTDPAQDPSTNGGRERQRLKLRVDRDGDGNISLREFHAFVNGRLDNDTVKRIFNAADKDQNGQLSRREFGKAVSLAAKAKIKENAPDKDGDGSISLREFYVFVNGRLDNDTVKRIFNAADKDQDGNLSRREFAYAMKLGIKAYRTQNADGSEDCEGNCERNEGDGSKERTGQNLRERLREKVRERIRERRQNQRQGNGRS